MLNRRDLLRTAAAGTGASLLGAAPGRSAMRRQIERTNRFGVALFTIPKLLDQDFAGALKLLADIGDKEVQFYGPYPFSVPAAHERWKSLSPSLGLKASGFFGWSP